MKVTTKHSANKLARELPALRPALPYFMYSADSLMYMARFASFEQLHKGAPSWSAESMAFGAQRLCDIAGSGEKYIYDVYTAEEAKSDAEMKKVKLFRFPGEAGRPFAIVCAGGGYRCVCSQVEGFPIAARLNALGYNAFVLNYRVGKGELFPKPIDDLAAALRFILANAESFKIDPEHYIVTGFSAGGNLCASWGMDNCGYAHYGLKKPDALFPVYPFVSFALEESGNEEFMDTMYGKGCSADTVDKYDVLKHLSAYPPCYIVACKDDDTVPPRQSETLKAELDKLGIEAVLEMGEKGGHGFGDGGGTDVEGWINRAVELWERQLK